MSFSHDDVADQVKDISTMASMIKGCEVVLDRITNKRMIIMCTGRNVADSMVEYLKHDGYPIVQAAAGLVSTNYYVEVRFNYPY